jgi:hypothetical protein
MDAKRTQRVNEVMSALLQPGEQVEVASVANVGRVTLGRKVAVAAAAAVFSGGTMTMHYRPARFYVVLTSQRLLCLGSSTWTGRPVPKITLQVPRAAIAGTTEPVRRVTLAFDVLISGQENALRMTFPMPLRDDGDRIAASLGVAAAP